MHKNVIKEIKKTKKQKNLLLFPLCEGLTHNSRDFIIWKQITKSFSKQMYWNR